MTSTLAISFAGGTLIEAGIDEAGRGCLAGPVYAAAVILDNDIPSEISKQLDDSKKLSEKSRNTLRILIERHAIDYGVASADNKEIDNINILNASILAMHRAIKKLRKTPELLIVDGNRFRQYGMINHVCVVKGDGLFFSIAAASVLAKTHRDEFMIMAHSDFPQYNWLSNKGYPTAAHKQSILKHGLCPLHRQSFNNGLQRKLDFGDKQT